MASGNWMFSAATGVTVRSLTVAVPKSGTVCVPRTTWPAWSAIAACVNNAPGSDVSVVQRKVPDRASWPKPMPFVSRSSATTV